MLLGVVSGAGGTSPGCTAPAAASLLWVGRAGPQQALITAVWYCRPPAAIPTLSDMSTLSALLPVPTPMATLAPAEGVRCGRDG